MELYKKILVLLDCSPVDSVILTHIKQLSKIHKSKVHFFHVIHSHTLDQERFMASKAIKCLTEAAQELQKSGIEVTYQWVEGEPVAEVLKVIQNPEWDLIAMATHGHKFLADFITGSVSEAVKHNTTKPVLLIRGNITTQ